MKIVLDTNIYLAGLMMTGFCYDLTQYIFDAKHNHQIFISPDIIMELYNKVAQKKEASSSQSLNWLIGELNKTAILVEPSEKLTVVKRDPSDNKILECAVSAHADLIISMDKDLLKLKNFREIGIIHPKNFFYMLPKNERKSA